MKLPSKKDDSADSSAVEKHRAGTQLVKENERSRRMYIIRKGKARVYKTYLDHRVTLAILGEGEVFGEMSFFDAEPRSASVEALTDLTVAVLDGDQATAQIAGLPGWIFPIFRTIFHRFREADRKITVLQSMNEYQKKAFKTDNVGKAVYLELLRFVRALELVVAQEKTEKDPVPKSERVYKALDDLLGGRIIGLRVFWRMLKEYELIDNRQEEIEGKVVLAQDAIEKWKSYLLDEISKERFLLLSHSAIALLGRTIGFARQESGHTDSKSMTVQFRDIEIESLPLYQDALKELKARGFISTAADSFTISPEILGPLYTYQSILKVFDHTIVNLD